MGLMQVNPATVQVDNFSEIATLAAGVSPHYRTAGNPVPPMLKRVHFAGGERQLLLRFWQGASGYWRGPSAWKAWFLAISLIANVLLQLLTQYGLNFWNRDFFNAIGS